MSLSDKQMDSVPISSEWQDYLHYKPEDVREAVRELKRKFEEPLTKNIHKKTKVFYKEFLSEIDEIFGEKLI